jgi:GT2 family glycosyltransferase
MIQYFTPFDINKNIGKAYNESMSLLPNDDDWGCLLDGDTMFLTPNYGKQLYDIVENYKNLNDIGLFTCLTNRTGNPYQRYNGVLSENSDLKNHRDIAYQLQKEFYLNISEIPRTISGHLMLIQKKIWKSVGGFKEEGILKIDNDFSKKILLSGKKVFLMKGLYIFHYYRLFEGKRDKTHLK